MKNLKLKYKTLAISTILSISVFTFASNTSQIALLNTPTNAPVENKTFYEYYNVPLGQRFQLSTNSLEGDKYYLDASGEAMYTITTADDTSPFNNSSWAYWIPEDELEETNQGFSLNSNTQNTFEILFSAPSSHQNTTFFYSSLKSYTGKALQYQTTLSTTSNQHIKEQMSWTNNSSAFTTTPQTNQQMISSPMSRLVFNETNGTIQFFTYLEEHEDAHGDDDNHPHSFSTTDPDFVWITPSVANEKKLDANGKQIPSSDLTTPIAKRVINLSSGLADSSSAAILTPDFGTKIAYPDTVSTTTPKVELQENGDLKVSITLDEAATLPSAPTIVNSNGSVATGTNFALSTTRAINTYTSTITFAELDSIKPANDGHEDLVVTVNGYTINNVELLTSSTGELTTIVLGDLDGFGSNATSTGLSAGSIVGIVVGSIAAVSLVIWIISSRNHKTKNKSNKETAK